MQCKEILIQFIYNFNLGARTPIHLYPTLQMHRGSKCSSFVTMANQVTEIPGDHIVNKLLQRAELREISGE